MRVGKSLKRAALTPIISVVIAFAARAIFEDRLVAWFESKFESVLANDALQAVLGDIAVFLVIVLGLALAWTLNRANKIESRRDRWRGTVSHAIVGIQRLESLMRGELKPPFAYEYYAKGAEQLMQRELPAFRSAVALLLQNFGSSTDQQMKEFSLMKKPLGEIEYKGMQEWMGPELLSVKHFIDQVSDELAIETVVVASS